MKLLSVLISLTLIASTGDMYAKPVDTFTPEGGFEAGLDFNNAPSGWTVQPGDWQNKPNLSLKLSKEGASPDAEGKTYLRLANTGAPEEGMFRLSLTAALPAPAPAKVVLSWRIRAQIDALAAATEWSSVQCEVNYLDKQGNTLSTTNGALRLTRSTAGKWLEREITLEVPAGTVEINILPGLYLIKGTVDLDDIKLAPAL